MTAIATGSSALPYLSDLDRERAIRRRTNLAIACIFLVVASIIASSLICTSRADREIDQQYAAKLALYTDAAKTVELARQTKLAQERVASDAQLVTSLLETVPRSVILADLTDAMPAGVSLLSLSIQPANAIAKSASVNLTAIASSETQVAQFVQRLNQTKLLGGINVVLDDTPRKADGTRRFQIDAALDSAAR